MILVHPVLLPQSCIVSFYLRTGSRMSQGKILVVDDEKKIVDLVRTYLERDGYLVVEANDGRLALEAFQRESPDLVILDVMLPGMDGFEVCREIRRLSS